MSIIISKMWFFFNTDLPKCVIFYIELAACETVTDQGRPEIEGKFPDYQSDVILHTPPSFKSL